MGKMDSKLNIGKPDYHMANVHQLITSGVRKGDYK